MSLFDDFNGEDFESDTAVILDDEGVSLDSVQRRRNWILLTGKASRAFLKVFRQ